MKTPNKKFVTFQKEVDASLISSIKKVPHLSHYLSTRFTLNRGDMPHLMKF